MRMLSQVARALQQVFGHCAEEANLAAGVIQRQRKFTPTSLAQTFILAYLQKPDASVTDLAAMAVASGVEVSPQAVEQRFSEKLAAFFEDLFRRMTQLVVASEQALAPLLERFSEVLILDSSTVALPESQAARFRGCGGSVGCNTAALKLQTELDLRSGALRTVQIEEARIPDGASSRQQARPRRGSLRIADLGYFDTSVLAAIAQAAAFFLSRIQYHTSLYIAGQKTAGLVAWLNEQELPVIDQWIELGDHQRLRCRLIAWRVPPEAANRRRQKLRDKLRRKEGRQPQVAALAACDWMFLITNLPIEQLNVQEAIVLYRARWQIELLFKRWKSLGQIDRFETQREHCQMVRFWARMCAVVVQHWLTLGAAWSPGKNLSLARVAKLAREFARDIALAITNAHSLPKVLKCLSQIAATCCRRNKRKKIGCFELLRNPESLDYCLT